MVKEPSFFYVHHPDKKQKKMSVGKVNSVDWFSRNRCSHEVQLNLNKTTKCHIFTSYKRNCIQKLVKLKVLMSSFKCIL